MPIKKKRNKPLNLTNKLFGDITAAERILGATPPKWLCVCDFGHTFPVMTRLLTQGKITTCPICKEVNNDIDELEQDLQGKLHNDNTDTMANKLNDLATKVHITGVSQETVKKVIEMPSKLKEESFESLEEGIYLKYKNKLKNVNQWAEETNIPVQTIMSRLYSQWSITETFKDADFN